MAKPIFSWIADSWEMKLQRKKGSIIACDYKLQAQTQRDFFDAMIVETVIPALDGASKEPAYIKVKLSPETIRTAKASGKVEGGTKQRSSSPPTSRWTFPASIASGSARLTRSR